MSCKACEEAQKPNPKSITSLNGGTYVRVEAGNVLIVGCQEHLEELMGRRLIMIKVPEDE